MNFLHITARGGYPAPPIIPIVRQYLGKLRRNYTRCCSWTGAYHERICPNRCGSGRSGAL